MLYSMTGFGRGISRSKVGCITTEIRTVNHRYLDLVITLPRELQCLEPKIKNHLREILHRGRVEVDIERRAGEHPVKVEIDERLAKNYLASLEKLGRKLRLKDRLSLSLLYQLPGVMELRTSSLPEEAAWLETKKSIDNALQALLKMRSREGKFTESEIRKSLTLIKKKKEGIEKRLPVYIGKYRQELKTQLKTLPLKVQEGLSLVDKTLNSKVEENKLAAALNNLSDKMDVSEELSRFNSHLQQLDIFLKENKDAGRKINFTLQEMLREINTLSAKANDFALSQAAVIIKSEIEKIKEQIQNVE